jgi:hypothetical protein
MCTARHGGSPPRTWPDHTARPTASLGSMRSRGCRTWDLLEAMQLDPARRDSQMWVTSYARIYQKPGVPLFDLALTSLLRDRAPR